MWSWLPSIIGGIFGFAKDWIVRKQEHGIRLEEAKVTAEIARIQAEQVMIGDADVASLQAQERSWKDEFVVLMIFAPYIGSFIPGLQVYVKAGFVILGALPEWYQWALIGTIASVLALRFMIHLLPWNAKKI